MPRFFHIGVLLALATSLTSPSAAQTAVPKGSLAGARIQDVAVHANGDSVEVEIHTSGASPAPNTQAISAPDRIIVDFPGALPGEGMRTLAMKVNSGALKGIRTGLFFNNPPITRVVLDLSEPQSYQISTTKNAVILKLHAPGPDGAKLETTSQTATSGATVPIVRTPRLQNTVIAGNTITGGARVDTAAIPAPVETAPPPPPKPLVTVTFVDGMLTIHADKATLAQVLFEVQQKTQAEIAIPAGAEQEQVISDLGPAPARDVLASLLNGSPYNFIFVGSELNLERVIITKRDPNSF
jgi:hypothetical protein